MRWSPRPTTRAPAKRSGVARCPACASTRSRQNPVPRCPRQWPTTRRLLLLPEFGLVAYGFDGRERWRRELPPFRSFYGLGSSPIIERGVLVLLCDETRKPYLLGIDTASGKELADLA